MASFRIPAEEYAARRARLMAAMGEGSIALVAAAMALRMAGAVGTKAGSPTPLAPIGSLTT